ncbi:hypothetical protein Tco_0547886 [Tanacetum coccineum]
MEHGFLSQKGSGRGRGVKEKDLNRNKRNTTSGIGLSTESDDTMDEDTSVGVASAVKEGVTPYVVDKMVEMEKISSVEDTTVLGSFPPLSTPGTTKAGNALGKSSYANVTGKYGLVRSMFSSSTGLFSFKFGSMDGLYAMLENVWVKLHAVPVTAFNEDGLSAIVTKLGTPLMLDSYTSDMCMQSWGREGHYICNVRVEHECKPPRCVSYKVFGHIHEECPKNTGVGEKKTLKKPSQTSRGVPVGPKMGFKPQKEYRHVPKNPTAISSSNKKKGVVPTIEVSNSNPFEVLNLVDNDMELGTNRGTTNLENNKATSSGSSFMNVANSSTRTTPIIDKTNSYLDLISKCD